VNCAGRERELNIDASVAMLKIDMQGFRTTSRTERVRSHAGRTSLVLRVAWLVLISVSQRACLRGNNAERQQKAQIGPAGLVPATHADYSSSSL